MSELNKRISRRKLLRIAVPGLSLIFSGCSEQSAKQGYYDKRMHKFQESERVLRRAMTKKLKRGFEAAKTEKLKLDRDVEPVRKRGRRRI